MLSCKDYMGNHSCTGKCRSSLNKGTSTCCVFCHHKDNCDQICVDATGYNSNAIEHSSFYYTNGKEDIEAFCFNEKEVGFSIDFGSDTIKINIERIVVNEDLKGKLISRWEIKGKFLREKVSQEDSKCLLEFCRSLYSSIQMLERWGRGKDDIAIHMHRVINETLSLGTVGSRSGDDLVC